MLLITSPEMADGKTTLTTNLAAAIAQSGKRVLLIDGDMRRPRVHSALGLRSEIGLSEVLLGEIAVENAIQPTVMDHLTVLSAGRCPANPAELLSSPRFPALLAAVRTQYDYVLIDTPPLLAVSDPCVVTPHADGVILVIRLGKNRAESVEQARELLFNHHAQPLGVVINGVPDKDGYGKYGYGNYGDYNYGYGYAQRADQANPMPAESIHPGAPAMTTVAWISEGPTPPTAPVAPALRP